MPLSSMPTLLIAISLVCAVWLGGRLLIAKTAISKLRGPPRRSWLTGCLEQLYDKQAWAFHKELVEKYGSACRLAGLFGADGLYVTDPRALESILIKDQSSYEENSVFIASNKLLFGEGLIGTTGEQHSRQRKMMSPVFSTKRIRDLLPTMYPIAYTLRRILLEEVTSGKAEIDVYRWSSRATFELISQAGMGYSFNSLEGDKEDEYTDAVGSFVPLYMKLNFFRLLIPYVVRIGSARFRRRVLDCIPFPAVQHIKGISDIMERTSQKIFHSKKEALGRDEKEILSEVGSGKDIISVLLKANLAARPEDRLAESEIFGQMNVLIFASHDTSTSAISRTLQQLAFHPDSQERLRAEINEACDHQEKLDYDTLIALPFLDAIYRETLRVYPPAPFLSRCATRDTVLPLVWPIEDVGGKEINEIPVQKDTEIFISVLHANRCKAIWGEDADDWKPERWLSPLPESVSKAHLPGIYSSMMTFWGGGRSCIGFKFAELEIKLLLAVLLDTFIFEPGEEEAEWNMGIICSPVVRSIGDETPRLPLKISAIGKVDRSA